MKAGRAVVVLACVVATAGCSVQARVDSATTPTKPAASPTTTSAYGPLQPDPRLSPFYAQQLAWRSCDGDFQCSTLRVPLSYDDPTKGSIGLSVIRLRSSDPSSRLGSLVVNPGGPGGSGVDYARSARGITTDEVRAHYDVVGFDPRGVGESSPIECLNDKQTDAFIAADASPDDPAETKRLTDLSAQFGQLCQKRSPTLVPNVGTRDAARDMDILRAAVGDQKLNYLGKSYGTFLGATYAEQFPQNVGRMVLDGAIDPSLDASQLALGQAQGFELALRRFASECPNLQGCPLSRDTDTAVRQVRDFLAKVNATPLPTSSGRQLNESLATLGIVGSLYSRDGSWPTLASALGTAFDGDGTDLLDIGDYYTDREPSGRYATNANDAIYAVNCYDKPATPDATTTEALATEWTAKAPTFGAYLAWGNLPCATWPAHSPVPPHEVVAAGSPPIVVVGTTYDPATPVQWAKALATQLSKGVYLEWRGDGHTAYQRGSRCIDEKVDAYLVNGVTPKDATVCD